MAICKISGHFHHSAKHASHFSEFVKKVTTSSITTFTTPCKTRWYSYLEAMRQYIKLSDVLRQWVDKPEHAYLGLDVVSVNILDEVDL